MLVDAHVHIHRSFELGTFFEAAASNFQRNAAALGLSDATVGCLMLSETHEENAFTRARDWLASGRDGWTLGATDEAISLTASNRRGTKIILIAGRQLVTRERLEVLALGTRSRFNAGIPLIETISEVDEEGGIPVVPWGFGKWWFSRGKRVRDLLQDPPVPTWFIGDNANRPSAALQPRILARAAARGVAVLPGSDPLPLREHQRLVANYGLVLRGGMESTAPGRGVKKLLRNVQGQPEVFGTRLGLRSFLRSQIALRFRERG